MDVKFFDSLFEGDSPDGIKFCMGLSGGDFWMRPAGCNALYRNNVTDSTAEGINEDLDIADMLAATNTVIDVIYLEDIVRHQPSQRYLYILRGISGCGREQKGFNAAVRISFDSQGNITDGFCNDIFCISARQVDGGKVCLVWYYCPLKQPGHCKGFDIFWDGGNGIVDYNNRLSSVDYKGSVFYEYITDALDEGVYKFSIKAVSEGKISSGFGGDIVIQVAGATVLTPDLPMDL